MAKVKYVLLVPLHYNDASVVPQPILDGILHELFRLAGGYTLAGTVRGTYRMPDGTKHADELLEIWVGIDEAQADSLRQLVARFGTLLGQEAMYLERTGGTIQLIPPSNGKSKSNEYGKGQANS